MGAGGSKAKNTTNVKTKSIVEAIAKNIMECKSNVLVKQSFIVSGNYNIIKNSKQVQYVKLSTSCGQNAQNIANIQQSVTNAIKQTAKSQSVSLIGVLGKSNSEVDANIENEVRQKINQETITNIINNSNATQELIISGDNNIIDNFNQSQTFDIIYDNTQKVVNKLSSVQAIDNSSNQSSEATQANPVSQIIDSVGSVITGAYGIIAIVIIAIIFGIVFLFRGFNDDQSDNFIDQPYIYTTNQNY